MWFKAISEIKIKLEKSELISVADDNGVEVLAAFFGLQGVASTFYFSRPTIGSSVQINKYLGLDGREISK